MRDSMWSQTLSNDVIFPFFAQRPASCNLLVVDGVSSYFWLTLLLRVRTLGVLSVWAGCSGALDSSDLCIFVIPCPL